MEFFPNFITYFLNFSWSLVKIPKRLAFPFQTMWNHITSVFLNYSNSRFGSLKAHFIWVMVYCEYRGQWKKFFYMLSTYSKSSKAMWNSLLFLNWDWKIYTGIEVRVDGCATLNSFWAVISSVRVPMKWGTILMHSKTIMLNLVQKFSI